MDFSGCGTLFLAILISLLIFFMIWNRRSKLPPGPTPLPLIGNLLQVRNGEMAKTLMELGEQYGPVFTFYFGPSPVIVFCGFDAVKEALVDYGEDFVGRGKQPTVDRVFQGYGLITSEGDRWKQLRRFSLTTLRNFGVGKRTIEERIKDEASCLVEELQTYKQLPVNPAMIISKAVTNVISSVVFGTRFDYSDKRFHRMLDIFYETFELMSSIWGQIQDMVPWLMNHIPGPHQNIVTLLEELNEFIAERIKLNQDTLDPSSPRDYIDCFLLKMQEEKDNPASEFNYKNLILTLNNLFFAGGETVATTLKHGLLLLLKYPDIQAKLHEEIDSVIGQNRSPNIEDRNKMPYTEAVIHEIQRFANVIPMNAPHSATRDTYFRGYTIPQGTGVCALLCSVLGDPKYFATPNKFNPNHFLDSKGHFIKNEAFLPFSTGKRICLGEGLARIELFLFLTNILQNFVLTSDTQFTEADITPRMTGFANVPISYELSFVPR
ncbi:cytochrome P450 family 2 subfamily A member 6 gene 10 L homeolog [Xenopus laevis]|uniref:Cytochrome P450 family 2 subfamily A member 6 gene 10 L homeolog n=1 Tax=Xenopus laevis TaxID=8355 RepID=Q68FI6_XENLA|nr:cytochrome P450 family 2 subfamily A member 6 gene 10 L homeolog [Xenopus laevis]AAH79802.1 MGC86391 protein [Xenopus laevis]